MLDFYELHMTIMPLEATPPLHFLISFLSVILSWQPFKLVPLLAYSVGFLCWRTVCNWLSVNIYATILSWSDYCNLYFMWKSN